MLQSFVLFLLEQEKQKVGIAMKTLGSEIARPGEQEPARARDKRHSIFLIGSIRRGLGQPKERALCRNLSRTGMRAESRHPWVTGTRILCELRGIGEIAAKVAWSRGQAMGIRFDSPIDPARV